jgi:hypothetical protein
MGKMKEVFMEMREELIEHLTVNPGSLDDQLEFLLEKGYWIQVSPLAKADPTEWIVGIYVRGKTTWVTEKCHSGFKTYSEAFNWAFEEILNIDYKKQKK